MLYPRLESLDCVMDWGGVRGLEAQTMAMAENAAKADL